MFKRCLPIVAGLALLASCAQTLEGTNPIADPIQQPGDEDVIPDLMSTEGADSVTSLAAGKANSVFVAGYTYGYSKQNKFSDYVFLRRYDSDGKLLWGKHIDRCNVQITDPSPSDNLVACGETGGQIATDEMSNVYLLSQRKKTFINGLRTCVSYLAKFDMNGAQLWEKEVNLQAPDNRLGVSGLAVDKAGNSTLLAPSYDAEQPQAKLFRYNTDGEKLWEREIEDLGFASIAIAEDAIYLSGTSVLEINPAPRVQKWLIDGTQAWERTYDDFYVLILTRIIHTQDDNLYLVTGSSILDSEQDNYGTVEIAKLDNSGTVLWRDTLEPTPHWTFETAISDHKGRLYVVGGADDWEESGESYNYVRRYSANGKRDWTYRFTSSRFTSIFRGGGTPYALAVAQAPGDTEPLTRVYMGGSNGGDDAFVFAADDVTGDDNYTADVPDLNPRWIKH